MRKHKWEVKELFHWHGYLSYPPDFDMRLFGDKKGYCSLQLPCKIMSILYLFQPCSKLRCTVETEDAGISHGLWSWRWQSLHKSDYPETSNKKLFVSYFLNTKCVTSEHKDQLKTLECHSYIWLVGHVWCLVALYRTDIKTDRQTHVSSPSTLSNQPHTMGGVLRNFHICLPTEMKGTEVSVWYFDCIKECLYLLLLILGSLLCNWGKSSDLTG